MNRDEVFHAIMNCVAHLYWRLSPADVEELELVIRAMHKATC